MRKREEAPKELRCSFCNKARCQVMKLIAGPQVYICDECIDLCNEIIGVQPPNQEFATAPDAAGEANAGAAWVRISDGEGRVVEAREGEDGWRVTALANAVLPEQFLAWLPHKLSKGGSACIEEFVVRGNDGKAMAVFYLREFGLEFLLTHQSVAAKRSEPGPDPDQEPLRQRSTLRLEPADEAVKCSFCKQERRHVDNLIAGYRVRICSDCIEECRSLLAKETVPE